MTKKIVCAHCNERITTHKDLVVAGKYMFTFHEACYLEAKQQLAHRVSYRINSPVFWYILVGLNLLLGAVCLVFPGAWQDLAWFFLITNVPLLLFRAMAYVGFERHLKA